MSLHTYKSPREREAVRGKTRLCIFQLGCFVDGIPVGATLLDRLVLALPPVELPLHLIRKRLAGSQPSLLPFPHARTHGPWLLPARPQRLLAHPAHGQRGHLLRNALLLRLVFAFRPRNRRKTHVRRWLPFLPSAGHRVVVLIMETNQTPTADAYITAFKRKGHFDALRKELLGAFESSPANDDLSERLRRVVDGEVERDPSLLARDRSKAATLIAGAVDRTDIYLNAEKEIEQRILTSVAFKEKLDASIREIVESANAKP